MFDAIAKMLGISTYTPSIGEGAARADSRLTIHRHMQAVRVEPALPAFADARKALARRRVKRWQRKHPLTEAPGHIKRMSREQ